ncbi:SpoIIE family protein phosphatase [Streptomyces sp. NBC_00893]|uniref:SpoIIE family protein phosphatase n=1 Tax=Streptomyces sp. NBC_00893 TaxID=2975862 RepID=UPI0022587250|nr:SpoIIE family protein phosphatase [Streptomyces sp. NBC_00893]MCX4847474.1 SpoIIE family protein phosphatase [Streptomyces sp. NBC_00893]
MQETASTPAAGSGLELLDPALVRVMQETGASMGAVYLLPSGETVLRMALLAGIPPQIVAPWVLVPLSAPIPVADAVGERRVVWVAGREEMARRYPRPALVVPYQFAVAAAPITTGDTDRGSLLLLWPGSHAPQLSRQERDAIDVFCRRTGLLLQRAAGSGRPVLAGAEPRVLPPCRSHTPRPGEALAAVDFAERLPEGCCALDLEGRISFITTAAAQLVGADIPDLLGALPSEALPWLDDPVFEECYRSAVVSRRPMSFTARRPPDRWLSFQLHSNASGTSVRITPAPTASAENTPEPQYTASPTTPSRARELYHLLHLAATLTEAVGVQDVVDRVPRQIMPAFGIQALAVMTAEEGRLRIIGHLGYTTELMDRFDATPLTSSTPAVRVLATGIPAFFATFADLRRAYPPATLQDNMAAWAFLPLTASGRTVGSMVLAYDRPHPFAAEERAILTSIAGLVAQALERARLYDAQYQLAHSLQAALLPHALPLVPGLDLAARYLPTTHGVDIGGDFYDLIRLDETNAAATIGDVQGHNVNAAALMGQVRTAVHATAGASPGEVLARTNRLLTDLDPGLFTSCLYIHLDLAHHRARLATAGHPPPLLRHPDGHAEVLDVPPGLVLGIDPTADYTTTEIPLPPGAVLALYTDGLVETPGVDIEDAIGRLADHLARVPGRTAESLADNLVHHATQCAPRNDDIALLVINVLRAGG